MNGAARVASVALAVVALGACASRPDTPVTTAYLDARRAAGIPDCPATAADAAPVPGGLPKVSLECLGGTSRVNLTGLARRPTVIVAWAQWCDPCRAEAPMLARTLPGYGDRLNVLLVDTADPRTDMAVDFAHDAGLTRWPVVVDPDWKLPSGLGVAHALPVTYLVAADGHVADKHLGAWPDADAFHRAVSTTLGVTA